jgi:hypothetical protein
MGKQAFMAPDQVEQRLPTRDEARQAAALLLRCNGMDLDDWTEGEWPTDVDFLKSLAEPEPVLDPEPESDDGYYRPDASGYSRADEEWFFDMDGKP